MFETILRNSNVTEAHFEIKEEGYTVKLRVFGLGIGKESEVYPHSEEFYNQLEEYIESPKGSILSCINPDIDTIALNQGRIDNKGIRVACLPSYPMGCSLLIRFKY